MFADIAGSTELTEQWGAEVFRDMLRDYRDQIGHCVTRFGGHVANYFGDGTLIYFGYPTANERDAERAVDAALAIQASLRRLERQRAGPPLRLRVRIAVHTGSVVAGDIRSANAAEALAVIGNAPNVAARLQETAEPDSVTISDTTYALVRHAFHCRALGKITLKGLARPVARYAVEGAKKRRIRVSPKPISVQLIGREQPAALLRTAWLSARAASGHFVLISGEAGIGKTRLVSEFAATAAQDCLCITLRCSPIHENTALFPVIQHINDVLGFTGNDLAPEHKRQRLARALGPLASDTAGGAALFEGLLGIMAAEEPTIAAGISLQRESAALRRRMIEWLAQRAAIKPVLLVIEDVHWADPSTLELLEELSHGVTSLRLLALLTSRPGPPLDWVEAAGGKAIVLGRLGHEQTRRMIGLVAGGAALSKTAVEGLLARTEGVPLFIEEITRAVIEAAADGDARTSVAIPSSLQESLSGRIDRADVDRDLLQLIGTLGREFSFSLLLNLCQDRGYDLPRELGKLVEAGLLQRHEAPGAPRYAFRHALIHDAVYQSQLNERRRSNHRRIAETLVSDFPDTCEHAPELVANHLIEAGDAAAAIPFLQRAAQVAVRRSANVEAARYLERALAASQASPPGRDRTHSELGMLNTLGVVQSARFGFASAQAGDAFAKAREVCRGLGRIPGVFPVLHGLYRFYFVRVDLNATAGLAREMFTIARQFSAPGLMLEAARAAGNCRFLMGQFGKAERHFARALSIYRTEEHASHRFEYGTDPLVVASSMSAIVAHLSGDAERARDLMARALMAADELNHPYSQCWALSFACVLCAISGDIEPIEGLARRQLDTAIRNDFVFWSLSPDIMLGWVATLRSRDDRGLASMDRAIEGWRRSGAEAYLPFFLSLLAEACLVLGQFDRAGLALAEAHALAGRNGEHWWRAELHRLSGRCAAEMRSVRLVDAAHCG